MFKFFNSTSPAGLLSSKLCNEKTFYQQFTKDLKSCQQELLIESPYLTMRRVKLLAPELVKLTRRGVRVTVATRNPSEHDTYLQAQAEISINYLNSLGVDVHLHSGYLHRKIAVIDRTVLWEGSLNILSQNDSCEIMRRIKSPKLSRQMLRFIGHKMRM